MPQKVLYYEKRHKEYREQRMEISLRPITEDNFIDAFNLKLAREQERFVSHPIRSLAQAYVYREQCQPFGIYHYDVPEYDVWHMMIDEAQQGKGYGKAALAQVLAYIGQRPFGDSGRIALTCNRDNEKALALYRAAGFAPSGNEDEDEIELVLNI